MFAIDQYFASKASGTTSLAQLFVDLPTWDLTTPSPPHGLSKTTTATSSSASSSSGNNESLHKSSPEDTSTAIRKSHPRFSQKARSIMRTWFNKHIDNPYPSQDQRKELEEKSELSRNQISLWLANARRRHRAQCQREKECESSLGSLRPSQPIIPANVMLPPPIPALQSMPLDDLDALAGRFEVMNPFERWCSDLNLEHEAAALPDIANAVAQSPRKLEMPQSFGAYASSLTSGSMTDYAFDDVWNHSVASYETGLSSVMLTSECLESASMTSSSLEAPAAPVLAAHPKVSRRRCPSRHQGNQNYISTGTGRFWCTFCPERRFDTKHDWQRHEASQHVSVQSWACCITGGTTHTSDNVTFCTFCNMVSPDAAHLESHAYSACQEKEVLKRSFFRKDHFQQHLQLVHGCKYNSQMDAWKTEIATINSTCGFCTLQFGTWRERCDHIAAHFRNGLTMAHWDGKKGLQPYE